MAALSLIGSISPQLRFGGFRSKMTPDGSGRSWRSARFAPTDPPVVRHVMGCRHAHLAEVKGIFLEPDIRDKECNWGGDKLLSSVERHNVWTAFPT